MPDQVKHGIARFETNLSPQKAKVADFSPDFDH
jgi:hypothetical protein